MKISFEPRFQPCFPSVQVQLYYQNEVIIGVSQYGVTLDYEISDLSNDQRLRMITLVENETYELRGDCLLALNECGWNYAKAVTLLKLKQDERKGKKDEVGRTLYGTID